MLEIIFDVAKIILSVATIVFIIRMWRNEK